MKQLILGLGFVGLGFAAPAVTAQSVNAFKDASGNVYVMGLQPRETVLVGFQSVPVQKDLVADSCGTIAISGAVGQNISLIAPGKKWQVVSQNFPLQTTSYRCTNNSANWTNWSNAYDLVSDGFVADLKGVNFNGKTYITGFVPGVTVQMRATKKLETSKTANTCGFFVIKSSSKFGQNASLTSGFYILNRNTYSTPLPVRDDPLCRNGILYQRVN